MRKIIQTGAVLVALTALVVGCAGAGGSTDPIAVVKTDAGKVSFKDTVHPILLDHCIRCHGEHADGELSILTYEGVIKGGKTPGFIKPGDPAGSKIITSVEKTVEPFMPPKIFPALTEDRISAVKQWIEEGAENN
jgi:mono/diheme cytochrome c family protein